MSLILSVSLDRVPCVWPLLTHEGHASRTCDWHLAFGYIGSTGGWVVVGSGVRGGIHLSLHGVVVTPRSSLPIEDCLIIFKIDLSYV